MHEQPSPAHAWLKHLLGNWSITSECSMGPGQPPTQTTGQESVRLFGDLWILGEGRMGTPDAGASTLLTLGYDARRQQFVGTFVVSVMTHLWPYHGTLDSTGCILTLDSEGPSFSEDGALARYQDIHEVLSDTHRRLTSQVQQPDGSWQKFMTADYHRVG